MKKFILLVCISLNTVTYALNDDIKISGLLLGEMIFSNYDQGQGGRFTKKTDYSTFCFPRANINIDGNVNDYTSAHFTFNFRDSCGFGSKNDEWTFRKFGISDEAYINVSDPETGNYWSTIGIQYVPYGVYKRHQIPATMTQLLTQTQVAGIVAGHDYSEDINARIFLFSGKKSHGSAQQINNGGFSVKYKNLIFDWMYNIAGGVNYIVNRGNPSNPNTLNNFYRKRVSGASLSAKYNHKDLDFTGQLTSALSRFDQQDLQFCNKGAKPAAWILGAGYNFIYWNKAMRVGGNFQRSYESEHIRGFNQDRGLPIRRLQGDFEVELSQYLNVGLHVLEDKSYNNLKSLTMMISLLAEF